jgi:hypothetical protein
MAVVTLGCGRHMICRLTCGEITIVAVRAGTRHTAMAESYIRPVAGGQVTDVTLFRCRNVIGRLTGSQCAIVAI